MKQYYETYSSSEKLSTALAEFPVETKGVFKDSYAFKFIGLSDEHEEKDLRRALLTHLRKFLLELGPDFSLIG